MIFQDTQNEIDSAVKLIKDTKGTLFKMSLYIYSTLLIISTILIVIAFNSSNINVSAMFMNLGTEIFGIAFTLAFIQYFFGRFTKLIETTQDLEFNTKVLDDLKIETQELQNKNELKRKIIDDLQIEAQELQNKKAELREQLSNKLKDEQEKLKG